MASGDPFQAKTEGFIDRDFVKEYSVRCIFCSSTIYDTQVSSDRANLDNAPRTGSERADIFDF